MPTPRLLRPSLRRAIASMMLGLLAACTSRDREIFPPVSPAIVWPPPPDAARIRFVGQLASDRDLRRAPGLGELIFGAEPPREMRSPMGVCTDGASRIFVVDSHELAVHVFDLGSRRYERWSPPPQRAAFSHPVAAAYDPAGRLLVADAAAGALFAFDARGEFLATIAVDSLDRPCSIAIHPVDRRLFIADAAQHQVIVLSPDGVELARIGSRGPGPGEFNFPTGIALAPDGRLFVSDTLNFRIQVFSPALEPLRQFGRKGDLPGYFSQPKGIALDPDGHIYIVDANFEAVQVFDVDGRLLLSFGREGRGPGEFWLPGAIHIDANGRICIADTYNRRVQVFDYLPQGPTP